MVRGIQKHAIYRAVNVHTDTCENSTGEFRSWIRRRHNMMRMLIIIALIARIDEIPPQNKTVALE